jgi:hypothetical protein
VDAVDPPGAVGFLLDQPGLLEQSEMARHGRSADRQFERERTDRPGCVAEQRQDLAAMRVAERVERIALPVEPIGNHIVTVAMRLPMCVAP